MCRGRLSLTVRSKGKGGTDGKRRDSTTMTIATATFSIPPGRTGTVVLKLNAVGRALLSADHGRLSASLTILESSPTPAQTHTDSVHLVQQKAHGKASVKR
jgi:hypothetical protein